MIEYETRWFKDKPWLWVKSDYHCWKHLTKQHPRLPKTIIEELGNVKFVVQAGGNCGFYVAQYAEVVDTVVTFEPDPNNYFCLEYNCNEPNVTMYNLALGNEVCNVKMNVQKHNMGANRILGRKDSSNIKQIKLDSLNLEPDLIHLDIEGYEKQALLGMIETIKRCRPYIILERDRKDVRHQCENLLESLGYTRNKDMGPDILFKFKLDGNK